MRHTILLILAILSLSAFARAQGDKPPVKPDPNQIAAVKEQNARALQLNAIITTFNSAAAAKDWQTAANVAAELITIEPRWEFYAGLGNAQYNLAKYSEAASSYDLAVTKAGNWADLKTANAGTRAAVGLILTLEGNCYLKLKKNGDAMRFYSRAAEIDPNPGLAWFNLCATSYNTGDMDGAVKACERSIAADPTRADAWFIKGSALYGLGKLDANNKYVLPAGTREALTNYLELAPNGPHAADVKAMLETSP